MLATSRGAARRVAGGASYSVSLQISCSNSNNNNNNNNSGACIANRYPAWQEQHRQLSPIRSFSSTSCHQSRLGRTPISIPPGVDIHIGEPIVKPDATTWLKIPRRKVTVTGPLGNVSLSIPPYVTIAQDELERTATLSVDDSTVRNQREMWGTTWAYLQSHVKGVAEGHTAILRFVGVGYRASLERRPHLEQYPGQQFVVLKLGYTQNLVEAVPEGVSVTVASPTRVLLEGVEKEVVMSFAAQIAKWRRPEPYKGKGIFINDQTIKLKNKKGK